MEEGLNILDNGKQPQFLENGRGLKYFSKGKINSIFDNQIAYLLPTLLKTFLWLAKLFTIFYAHYYSKGTGTLAAQSNQECF